MTAPLSAEEIAELWNVKVFVDGIQASGATWEQLIEIAEDHARLMDECNDMRTLVDQHENMVEVCDALRAQLHNMEVNTVEALALVEANEGISDLRRQLDAANARIEKLKRVAEAARHVVRVSGEDLVYDDVDKLDMALAVFDDGEEKT